MSASDYDLQTQGLWQDWLNLQASADEALRNGAVHYFTCIRQGLCNKLALDALNLARLGQKDEGVFDHLVYLMEIYREVISLFEGPIRETSLKLVAGLCDILGSRLKQFEDEKIGPGNPVAKEKHSILETGILQATQHTEEQENVYLNKLFSPVNENCISELRKEIITGNASNAWQSLYESIVDEVFPSLYAYYRTNLQNCLTNIDDLEARKAANYYTDLLEREWEVLGIIVQVQVQALEMAYQNNEEAHAILTKLREAYQQTGPVVSGLRKLMQTASTPACKLDYEEFSLALAAGIVPPTYVEVSNPAFSEAFLPEADALFEGLRVNHLEMMHELQGLIAGDVSLANQAIDAFRNAQAGLLSWIEECAVYDEEISDLENADAPPSKPESETACPPEQGTEQDADTPASLDAEQPDAISDSGIPEQSTTPEDSSPINEPPPKPANHQEKEILSGIIETLDIKSDSLNESLQLYSTDSGTLLAATTEGMPILTKDDLTEAASQLQSKWHINPPAPDTIPDFFAGCISLAPFATYNEKLEKHISNCKVKVDKASFRFMKETLLYEISTYEEILYHSVSRLRESPIAQVANAVQILDETFQKLETLLTETGIEVIRPAPHSAFNGREHEVLMAEKQEGFAKGEIIKVMTSGYKQGGQVVLRANVIAAR